MAASTPETSSALVFYNPGSFDIVMQDATDLPTSSITITEPPQWVRRLHERMGEAYQALQALAKDVDRKNVQNTQELSAAYDEMLNSYLAVAQLFQAKTSATQQQIEQFQR